MCKKEYEAEPRTGIMGEADVLVAASAPGKCILFGEHAVVYGQPAVAVAIEQRLSISATKAASWSVDGSALDPTRHPHITMLRDRWLSDSEPMALHVSCLLYTSPSPRD